MLLSHLDTEIFILQWCQLEIFVIVKMRKYILTILSIRISSIPYNLITFFRTIYKDYFCQRNVLCCIHIFIILWIRNNALAIEAWTTYIKKGRESVKTNKFCKWITGGVASRVELWAWNLAQTILIS